MFNLECMIVSLIYYCLIMFKVGRIQSLCFGKRNPNLEDPSYIRYEQFSLSGFEFVGSFTTADNTVEPGSLVTALLG